MIYTYWLKLGRLQHLLDLVDLEKVQQSNSSRDFMTLNKEW